MFQYFTSTFPVECILGALCGTILALVYSKSMEVVDKVDIHYALIIVGFCGLFSFIYAYFRPLIYEVPLQAQSILGSLLALTSMTLTLFLISRLFRAMGIKPRR